MRARLPVALLIVVLGCGDPADGAGRVDDQCVEFNLCAQTGRCVVDDGVCVAATDAHCQQSEACSGEGACSAELGVCVPSAVGDACDLAMGTAGVNPCARDGRCQVLEGRCVAATDADCRPSANCTELGLCTRESFGCVVGAGDCATSSKCLEFGWCTRVDGRCVVGSNDDCLSSSGCLAHGHCSQRWGVCKARTDQDCARSERCKNGRRCTASEGECLTD